MTALSYQRPESLDRAIDLLCGGDSSDARIVLAGGTDLLVQMRMGTVVPQHVVDVKRIPELRGVEETSEGFRIGAAVSGAELGEHAALRAAWPGLVEATELIGSTQIQGRATLGGNVCNASPAADAVPALIAAEAQATIAGPDGRRCVPIGEVATGPGETSLDRGELLVDFRLPARPAGSGDAYLRLIPRSEMDIAVAGAAVSLALDDRGVCTTCRVALGAVAPRALLVDEAADALVGTTVDEASLARLAGASSAAAEPIDDLRGTRAYRIRVVGVLARRAAAKAAERARRPA